MLKRLNNSPDVSNDISSLEASEQEMILFLVDLALRNIRYKIEGNEEKLVSYFLAMKSQTGLLGLTINYLVGITKNKYDELKRKGMLKKLIEEHDKRELQQAEELARYLGRQQIEH